LRYAIICVDVRACSHDPPRRSSPPWRAPGVELLGSLADEVEAFNHRSPGVPPPPSAPGNGLHIDPIYF
jgi:hypothetical protein